MLGMINKSSELKLPPHKMWTTIPASSPLSSPRHLARTQYRPHLQTYQAPSTGGFSMPYRQCPTYNGWDNGGGRITPCDQLLKEVHVNARRFGWQYQQSKKESPCLLIGWRNYRESLEVFLDLLFTVLWRPWIKFDCFFSYWDGWLNGVDARG